MLLPGDRESNLEGVWWQQHIAFVSVWNYRFLHRDLVDILARNRTVKLRVARIMSIAAASTTALLRGLVDASVIRARADEIHALAKNIRLITFWVNFNALGGDGSVGENAGLDRGIRRSMMLVAQLLRDTERDHLNVLTAT